jgi:hypothetical protein
MYRRDKTDCPPPDFVEIDGQMMYGPIEADVIEWYDGQLAVDIGGTDYGPSTFLVDKDMMPEGTKKGDIVYVYREGILSDQADVVKVILPFEVMKKLNER